MTFLNNKSLMCGSIFIILTIPYSPVLLNFSLVQNGNLHFGNQGMENAKCQIGQGNAKSIGGVGCPTDPNHISSSIDTTNNIVISGSSSSTGS